MLVRFDDRRAGNRARLFSLRGPPYPENYLCKPRGGKMSIAVESFTLRISLCRGRDGCLPQQNSSDDGSEDS